jgi:hypothetical protein
VASNLDSDGLSSGKVHHSTGSGRGSHPVGSSEPPVGLVSPVGTCAEEGGNELTRKRGNEGEEKDEPRGATGSPLTYENPSPTPYIEGCLRRR